MPDEERVSEQEKMRDEICERVWREKAYKAIEAGFEAGWQAGWLARGKQAEDEVIERIKADPATMLCGRSLTEITRLVLEDEQRRDSLSCLLLPRRQGRDEV